MLHITNDALRVCEATIQELSGAQARTRCLRFFRFEHGMSVSLEFPRSDDEIVRSNGQAILAIPPEFVGLLSQMTLDVHDDGNLFLSR